MDRTETHTVTFAVDDVTPSTQPLPQLRTHEALVTLKPESCCDYTDLVVAGVQQNPLVAAVHLAFSQHLPLVLSPDMVWLAIAQGFSLHVQANAEALRSRLVGHQDKLVLQVARNDFVSGTPENPWAELFEQLADAVRGHVGDSVHDLLVPTFTTTGGVERAAFQVTLLETFKEYFEYEFMCLCGIPQVTLEGEPRDWAEIEARIEGLAAYDLDWWVESLRPVCRQFTRAAQGDVDVDHWRRIYKLRHAYGEDLINGWILRLFPYLNRGERPRRNPALNIVNGAPAEEFWWSLPAKDDGFTADGIASSSLPKGLATAPLSVTWMRGPGSPRTESKELLAGFVGVTQDEATLALRPKIGWLVRNTPAGR